VNEIYRLCHGGTSSGEARSVCSYPAIFLARALNFARRFLAAFGVKGVSLSRYGL